VNGEDVTILVIEDEKDTLDLLSCLLQGQGYRVQTACTSAEGLVAVQDSTVSLTLLDVMLPDMNGFDVCLKIKKNHPQLPIIILSARNKRIDIINGLDCGADDYVTKPFSNAELLARVRAVLRKSPTNTLHAPSQNGKEAGIGSDASFAVVPSLPCLPQPAAMGDAAIAQAETVPDAELLPIISHELRTPIAAIKGFITTLLSNHCYWDEHEREAFLENMNENVDQLSRLVENVLEIGRLDKGLQCHKRPTHLDYLVQRVLHNLSFRATRCEFVNEVPAHLPTVSADPLKVERVLHSLLENAIKFSPQGGSIRVLAQVKGKEIEVGVQDQGIGIHPEHLPHIFKKFYQAETSQGGIGLGLYITQRLVHLHGGRIWAKSQPDRGTTIYFTLPTSDTRLIPEHASASREHTIPLCPGPPGRRHRSNGRTTILIVEDDAQMRSYLEQNLQAEGYETLTTSHGSQAIELVRGEKLDLVLLDLLLPDVDGLTVCERVRRFSNVPIIIVTGRKTDQVRGLDLGADDYLVKPFSNQALLARVCALLRRAQIFDMSEPLTRLRLDSFEIDPTRHEVQTPQGTVRLTPTEHKLLYYLISNAGRVLTHQQLLTRVWGYKCDYQNDALWVNISRLRKKIEPDPNHPRYILTEPSIGYSFRAGRVHQLS
jgi:DNA-binding response OmpR family regulator/anti-sigma regulatory factor (Ser/Thr protein kinase)